MLIRYDEDNFNIPIKLQRTTSGLLTYQQTIAEILALKEELQKGSGSLFGIERGNTLKGILGNIDQTFGSKFLYPYCKKKLLVFYIL